MMFVALGKHSECLIRAENMNSRFWLKTRSSGFQSSENNPGSTGAQCQLWSEGLGTIKSIDFDIPMDNNGPL